MSGLTASSAPVRDNSSTRMVHGKIFAFKWCGPLRKNKQFNSEIFTSSQAEC
jgi:hypothetical protein